MQTAHVTHVQIANTVAVAHFSNGTVTSYSLEQLFGHSAANVLKHHAAQPKTVEGNLASLLGSIDQSGADSFDRACLPSQAGA